MPDQPEDDQKNPADRELGELLVQHLDTLRCFVRIHMSPDLRQREQDSDVVQSVCAELLAHPARFQWQGEVAFRSWLYRAVLDRVCNKLRFHRAERRDLGKEAPIEDSAQHVLGSYADMITPSRIAMSSELQVLLEQGIDELPASQRDVLVRARLLQMEHAAIAAELGITVESSRQLLHRAIAHLTMIVAKRG